MGDQMKKKRRKIKNRILKMITLIAVVIWVVSLCCIDSESLVPSVALIVSEIWIYLFVYVNRDMWGEVWQ